MEYIFGLFNDLDGILKGAIGSTICLLAVWIVQFIFKHLSKNFSLFNGKFRKRMLQAEWTPLNAIESNNKEIKILSYLLCLYPALHKVIRAFMFVTIGLWFSLYSNLFAASAYVCALYFFFSALTYVPDLGSFGNKDERSARLNELNESLDSSS